MMRRIQKVTRPSWLYLLIVLFHFHHTMDQAQAQIFSGPVSSAMGGSGRAGAEVTEIVFLNPAAAALSAGFEADAIYRDGYWAEGEHETGFALTMIENDPGNFAPGGIGYVRRRRSTSDAIWNEQYFMGVLGQPLSPQVALGLSAFRLEQAVDGGDKYVQWNGSLGLLITFNKNFGVAYVYDNAVQGSSTIPDPLKLITQHSLGVNYLFPRLIRVTADVTRWERNNPDGKGILAFGSEMKTGDFGLLRMGFELDDIRKRNSLTAGLGFQGPRLKINYSFAKPLKDTNGAMHSVDLRVPF